MIRYRLLVEATNQAWYRVRAYSVHCTGVLVVLRVATSGAFVADLEAVERVAAAAGVVGEVASEADVRTLDPVGDPTRENAEDAAGVVAAAV